MTSEFVLLHFDYISVIFACRYGGAEQRDIQLNQRPAEQNGDGAAEQQDIWRYHGGRWWVFLLLVREERKPGSYQRLRVSSAGVNKYEAEGEALSIKEELEMSFLFMFYWTTFTAAC